MKAGYQTLKSRILVALLSVLMVFGNVASPLAGAFSVYAESYRVSMGETGFDDMKVNGQRAYCLNKNARNGNYNASRAKLSEDLTRLSGFVNVDNINRYKEQITHLAWLATDENFASLLSYARKYQAGDNPLHVNLSKDGYEYAFDQDDLREVFAYLFWRYANGTSEKQFWNDFGISADFETKAHLYTKILGMVSSGENKPPAGSYPYVYYGGGGDQPVVVPEFPPEEEEPEPEPEISSTKASVSDGAITDEVHFKNVPVGYTIKVSLWKHNPSTNEWDWVNNLDQKKVIESNTTSPITFTFPKITNPGTYSVQAEVQNTTPEPILYHNDNKDDPAETVTIEEPTQELPDDGSFVVIRKVKRDGTGLAGAKMHVEDASGNKIKAKYYDESGNLVNINGDDYHFISTDGKVTAKSDTKLPDGKYYVVEDEAPAGYEIDGDGSEEFTISDNYGTATLGSTQVIGTKLNDQGVMMMADGSAYAFCVNPQATFLWQNGGTYTYTALSESQVDFDSFGKKNPQGESSYINGDIPSNIGLSKAKMEMIKKIIWATHDFIMTGDYSQDKTGIITNELGKPTYARGLVYKAAELAIASIAYQGSIKENKITDNNTEKLKSLYTALLGAARKEGRYAAYFAGYTEYSIIYLQTSNDSIQNLVIPGNPEVVISNKKKTTPTPVSGDVEVEVSKFGYEGTESNVTTTYLPGAKLQIQDADGNKVYPNDAEYFVSEDKPTKINLEPGTYYLVEIEPPAGYIKNEERKEFTVKAPTVTGINMSGNPRVYSEFPGHYAITSIGKTMEWPVLKVNTVDGVRRVACVEPEVQHPIDPTSGYSYVTEFDYDGGKYGIDSDQIVKIKRIIKAYHEEKSTLERKLKQLSDTRRLKDSAIDDSLIIAVNCAIAKVVAGKVYAMPGDAYNPDPRPQTLQYGNIYNVYNYLLEVAENGSDVEGALVFLDTGNSIQDVVALDLFGFSSETTEAKIGNEKEKKEGKLGTTVHAGNASGSATAPARLTAEQAGKITSVTDTIHYENLTPNARYYVTGTLVEVANGAVVKTVSGPKTVQLNTNASGTGDWTMTFDNVTLEAGKTYVVFEEANPYKNGDVKPEPHKEIGDTYQTIAVEDKVEVEKYVNNQVHSEIEYFDKDFEYEILAYVPQGATRATIEDTLVTNLEFACDEDDVKVSIVENNDHKVNGSVAGTSTSFNGVWAPVVTMDKDAGKLKVEIYETKGLNQAIGKWVKVTFKARIKKGAYDELLKKLQGQKSSISWHNNGEKDKNKTVLNNTGDKADPDYKNHQGIDNTAKYTVDFANGSTSNIETNTVTVKPETIKIYAKKAYANENAKWPVNILIKNGNETKGTIKIENANQVGESKELPKLLSGYTVEEASIPGYVQVSLTGEGTQSNPYIFTNRKEEYPVKVSKKALGGTELPGANITVTGENGFSTSWTSETTPKELSLKPGTYTLTETAAPAGYKPIETTIQFKVDENGNVELINVASSVADSVKCENGVIIITDKPEKDGEVEKYVNDKVHEEIVNFDAEFEYEVLAYVPLGATKATIEDTLEEGLVFAGSDGKGDLKVVYLEGDYDSNDHKVNGAVKNAKTVEFKNGYPRKTVTDRKITVEILNDYGLRQVLGKWVKLTFKAKIDPDYYDALLERIKTEGKTGNISWDRITDNKTVQNGNPADPKYSDHQGVDNTAQYKIEFGNDFTSNHETNTVTVKPETTKVEGKKVWVDSENQDGKRPASITINLLLDGVKIDSKIVTAEDNWEWSFDNLKKFEKKPYTVTEDKVEGYDTNITGSAAAGFEVTNTYTPETTKVEGEKIWDDADNQDGKRPASIKVKLLADGAVVRTETVTPDANGNWKYSFTGLPKYAAGEEINYTVSEEAVTDYSVSYDENSYNIKNSYTPEKTYVEVTKKWTDDNNRDGKRPSSVTVKLLANGADTGKSEVLNESNSWHAVFNDLPKKSGGKDIEYTVKEVPVPGYETVITKTSETGFVYQVENKYTPEKTQVPVEKVWDDADNQDGIRPTAVKVQLYADGVESGEPVELNAENKWKHTFTGLDKYNAGTLIKYTVDEVKDEVITGTDAAGTYAIAITGDATNGYNVKNTHTPETTKIEGEKTWSDANNQDGNRPASITIRLLADGAEVASKTVTATDEWKWSFTDLPKYKEGKVGKEIVYTISEDEVAEYTTEVDGYNVKNTHTPETTKVEGEKTWDDADNQDGKRPASITIRLLADGVEVADKTVTAADQWKWSFTDLPKYKKGKVGEEIKYTISEDEVKAYTTAVDKYNVTNTHEPETTTVSGIKTWNDNNNQDGKRPESITIRLLADGTEVADKTVTAEENWTWSFTGLPKYAEGKEIVYTIAEDEVTEYTTAVDKYNVTNTHEPETTEVPVTKTWDDNDDQDGARPESITFHLHANGSEVASKTVTEADDWNWTFTGLPKYAAGKEIVYTVTEDVVADYTTGIQGTNVTNTHAPGKTSISVTKVWNDDSDRDGIRPDSVTVKLFANGTFTGQQKDLDESNNWTWTFSDLDEKANGQKIKYTVEEDGVDNYTAEVTGSAETGYKVTNTYEPEKIEKSGEKTWSDANNQDGIRPTSITVHLFANGTEVASKTVTAKDDWKWTFTDLFKYENGEEIRYTITEDVVKGYDATINGLDVTNTHTPETTEVEGTKTWDDAGNQDGKRPTSIKVHLFADKKQLLTKTVEADAEGNWTYKFDNLPKYRDGGVEIKYTVAEDVPEGYKATVTGYDIVNKYTPEQTEIEGKKTWNDNNKDGNRPSEIKISLLANGVLKDTKTVTAEDGWKWKFENLDKFANGKEIVYTVTEEKVDHYATEINGTDVINTYTVPEKYVNNEVTWDFDNFDQEFEYEIMAFVTKDGKSLVITDTLVDALRFVGVNGGAKVYKMGEGYGSNNHKENGSVKDAGEEITDARISVEENKTLKVEIEDATPYQNHWIKVTFNAQIKPEAYERVKALINSRREGAEWADINDNGLIITKSAHHDGVPNKATYSLTTENDSTFEEETNTVTIEPKTTELRVKKSWGLRRLGNWPENTTVTFGLYAGTEELKGTVDADGVFTADPEAGQATVVLTTEEHKPVTVKGLPKLEGVKYTAREISVANLAGAAIVDYDNSEFTVGTAVKEAIKYIVRLFTGKGDDGVDEIEAWNKLKVKTVISKVDLGGKELPGAKIQILDAEGKIVEIDGEKLEWTSKNEPKEFYLDPGKYTMHEDAAPAGYAIATDIEFTVNEDGTVTVGNTTVDGNVVEMTDKPTEVKISKVDVGGEELPGAKIQILDTEGNIVELGGKKLEWTSTNEARVITGLPAGTYVMHEDAAPAGYELATDITFTIKEDGTVEVNGVVRSDGTVTMTDKLTEVKISKVDVGGEELPGAKIQILDAEGNIVDLDGEKLEWTSTNEARVITGLPAGTYVMHEDAAPAGYELATDITFTIKEDGTVEVNGVVRSDGTVTMTDVEKPEIEKYVDLDVHENLVQFDKPIRYDILAYVTKDAEKVVIEDELVRALEFADGTADLEKAAVASNEANKVVTSVAVKESNDHTAVNGTVATAGTAVENAVAKIEGQKLTVTIDKITAESGLRGNWVQVTFYAKYTAAMINAAEVGDFATIADNGAVISEIEEHEGTTNKSSYEIYVNNVSKYSDESNTVTVEAETEKVEAEKVWDNLDGTATWPSDVEEVKINVLKGSEVVDTITLTASAPKGTSKELPKLTDVVYKLDETTKVPGYKTTINGKTVTNRETENPDIGTTATDKADDDHVVEAAKNVTVVDEVAYKNLKVGKTYKVSGKLMDKSTGKALVVNGKEVTAEKEFKAETKDGSVKLEFTFDASALKGKSLVAFEYLYDGEKEIAVHAEINDVDQTVDIEEPEIEKYVDLDVHENLVEFDKPIRYDILAYVTKDAEKVVIEDELVSALEFADGTADLEKAAVASKDAKKVVTSVAVKESNDHTANGTVATTGTAVENAVAEIEGQKLTVTIDKITAESGLRGNWVQVTFYAKYTAAMIKAAEVGDADTITDNGAVISEIEEHEGTTNKSSYKIYVNNVSKYSDKSNTVTVEAETEDITVKKTWIIGGVANAEWPADTTVTFGIFERKAGAEDKLVKEVELNKDKTSAKVSKLPKLTGVTYVALETNVNGSEVKYDSAKAAGVVITDTMSYIVKLVADALGTDAATVTASNSSTEIEKYVNKTVHAELAEFDEEFTYDIMAYVPEGSTKVEIYDTLKDQLTLISSKDEIAASVVVKDTNDHTVEGSVSEDGEAVTASAKVEGNSVTVTVEDIEDQQLEGKWLQATLKARISDEYYAEIAKFLSGADDAKTAEELNISKVEDDGPVQGYEEDNHTGLVNKAKYKVFVDNESTSDHWTNEVTVEPETTKVEVSKEWLLDDETAEWPTGATVEVILKAEGEGADKTGVNGLTATLSKDAPRATFDNLPLVSTVKYSVEEGSVVNGGAYALGSVEDLGNGIFKITNKSYTPEIEKYVNKKTDDLAEGERDGTVHVDLSAFNEVYTYDIQAYITPDAKYVEVIDELRKVLEFVGEGPTSVVIKEGSAQNAPALTAAGEELADYEIDSNAWDANKLILTLGSDAEDAEVLDVAGKWLQITFDARIKSEYKSVEALKAEGERVWTAIVENDPIEDADVSEIDAFSGAEVSNHAGIVNDSYYNINKLVAGVDVDNMYQYSDRSNTVTVQPEEAEVYFSKTDLEGKELPGAEMKLTDANGRVIDEWTSEAEDHVLRLADGEYVLTEEAAPEGYYRVTTKMRFEVRDGVVTLLTAEVDNGAKLVLMTGNTIVLEDAPIVQEEHKREGKLATTVAAKNATGSATEAAVLTADEVAGKIDVKDTVYYEDLAKNTLYDVVGTLNEIPTNGAPIEIAKVSSTLKTNAAGTGVWTMTFKDVELEPGKKYVVFEKATNTEDSEEVVKHENPEDKAQTVIVAPTDVYFSKTDLDGKEIPGAEMKLTDANGNVIDEWTSTTEDHLLKLTNGEYILTEVAAPEGYMCVTTKMRFVVEDGTVTLLTAEVDNDGQILLMAGNTIVLADASKVQEEYEPPVEEEEEPPTIVEEPVKEVSKEIPPEVKTVKKIVETGDNATLYIWIAILIISMLATAVSVIRRRRTN